MLFVCGAILIFCMSIASQLSEVFVFGIGHAQRPILFYVFLMLIAFAAYFVAWKSTDGKKLNRVHVFWIISVAVLCRLIFFPSNMIQESDAYRYVWDGQAVLHQVSPFDESPEYAATEGWASDAVLQNEQAALTASRINFPKIRTIYPPVSHYIFAFSQIISAWDFSGLKLLIWIAEMLILLLIGLLVRNCLIPQNALILYGWCPLLIKEYSNSLHVDVFAAFFLLLSVYCLIKNWSIGSFGALAGAFLVKLFPIILLPFYVIYGLKQWGVKKTLVGICSFGLAVLLAYLPFLASGTYLFEGFAVFMKHWKVNAGLLTFFEWMMPTLWAKVLGGIIFTCLYLWAGINLCRNVSLRGWAHTCLIVTAGLFLCSATGNPWYLIWIFPFLIFFKSNALVCLSGVLFLYYLDFYFMYRGLSDIFRYVILVEYFIFYFILSWELWKKRDLLHSWFRFSMKLKS